MKLNNKCPKCGSTDVIADAKAIDRGHSDFQREMSIATFTKPDALIFKEKKQTTVSAWVCTDCGFIEFYADSPTTIKLPKA
jgi:predicted nucleic-acid-binding Zn-ribbon protein